jgi:DNA primase
MAKEAPQIVEVPGPEGTREVRISSPGRVLWPEPGITKLDLAHYMVAAGQGVMRALGDRPVTLERYPDGVGGESFYSKNPPRGVPAY